MSAQEEFDRTYITAREICEKLQITRTGIVYGRQRGMLPEPIRVNGGQLLIWKREAVDPFLEAWQLNLRARRRELTS
jgi:predicted DNA-binding transcriptional regulator AlpA